MDFLEETLARIPGIRQAETPGHYIKQRLATQADQLSNAARIQGAIELANEALCKLTTLCYECIDKQPVNVDRVTYRLLIPMPWGDSGYRYWGLRSIEARILRSVLMKRAHSDPQRALFDYGDRQWFLNAHTYKSAAAALAYLKSAPITAREWMPVVNSWNERERQRENDRVKRGVRVSPK